MTELGIGEEDYLNRSRGVKAQFVVVRAAPIPISCHIEDDKRLMLFVILSSKAFITKWSRL